MRTTRIGQIHNSSICKSKPDFFPETTEIKGFLENLISFLECVPKPRFFPSKLGFYPKSLFRKRQMPAITIAVSRGEVEEIRGTACAGFRSTSPRRPWRGRFLPVLSKLCEKYEKKRANYKTQC